MLSLKTILKIKLNSSSNPTGVISLLLQGSLTFTKSNPTLYAIRNTVWSNLIYIKLKFLSVILSAQRAFTIYRTLYTNFKK